MRCNVGPKKVAWYRKLTGLPVVSATVRGGTDHRVNLCLENGSVVYLYKDGTVAPSDMRCNIFQAGL